MSDVIVAIGKTRSRVSNGSRVLAGVDGRSKEARRYRDVMDGYIVQFDATEEAELSLCRRAAGLAVWLEQQESLVAKGAPIDIGAMTTASNAHRRLLRDLAASKRARQRARRVSA